MPTPRIDPDLPPGVTLSQTSLGVLLVEHDGKAVGWISQRNSWWHASRSNSGTGPGIPLGEYPSQTLAVNAILRA